MEKLLFALALAFGVFAVVARHNLHAQMEADHSDEVVAQHSFNDSPTSPQSLSYGISKVTRTPTSIPKRAYAPPPPQNILAKNFSSNKVSSLIPQIQANNEHSVDALEKALSETDQARSQSLKLTVLQAALNMTVGHEDYKLHDMMMREMTDNVIQSPVSPTNSLSPEEMANLETSRMVVSTAYKIFLNSAKSSEEVLSDTQRVLGYQSDPITRQLINYDCLGRYPELRGKLGDN